METLYYGDLISIIETTLWRPNFGDLILWKLYYRYLIMETIDYGYLIQRPSLYYQIYRQYRDSVLGHHNIRSP